MPRNVENRKIEANAHHFKNENVTKRAIIVALIITLSTAYSLGTVYLAPTGNPSEAANLAKSFNDLVLTAAAIFFAFAFADARYWPTIGEAAAASHFYTWGIAVVISMAVDWTGTYLGSAPGAQLSLILWFISSALAILSLLRILRLGDPARINVYLSRNLSRCLKRSDPERFLRATREAVVIEADLTVRDLTDQVERALRETEPKPKTVQFTAQFVSEIVWASLSGSISGSTAARTIRMALDPEILITERKKTTRSASPSSEIIHQAICVFVPLLSRFASQAKALITDETKHDFKAITNASRDLLAEYASLMDPEPKSNESAVEKFVSKFDAVQTLDCFRAFTIRPQPEGTAAVYSTYQHIADERFQGDYWNGAPILASLSSSAASPGINLKHELSWICGIAILSSTLPSVVEILSTDGVTGDSTAVCAWTRIMLSLGPLSDAEAAKAEWMESVLAYVPRTGHPGDPAPDDYDMALSLAVLCLLRLTPWKSTMHAIEAKTFYSAFQPSMREKLRVLLSRRIGKDLHQIDARMTARIRKVLVAA